jgi:hypothetical protein
LLLITLLVVILIKSSSSSVVISECDTEFSVNDGLDPTVIFRKNLSLKLSMEWHAFWKKIVVKQID